ncbi:hypothetical protein AB4072_15380 [Microvirga sp. 2MCAF38]|uniref:hypothetical protein n=1 Tax=Microvirga sp. 2MCAF38 TaxID=3232989 RepID=UPI003F945027
MALSEAADFARSQGIGVELVAVLDRTDSATKSAFENSDLAAFAAVQALYVDLGSVSLARNEGCSVARGRYFEIADGDDIIPFSNIARMYFEAERLGEQAIIVPQILMGFGKNYHVVEYFNQDEIFAPALIKYHLFTSKIFFPRSLFEVLQYKDVPLSNGYAYEDWHFNCEAIGLGFKFKVAENTILFYRQRQNSRNHEADRISARQIPPSRLFTPKTYLRIFNDAISQFKESAELYRSGSSKIRGKKILEDQDIRLAMSRANAIEPAIELGRYYWDCQGYFSTIHVPPEIGVDYYTLCELVGADTFTEVVFLPDRLKNLQDTAIFAPLRDSKDATSNSRILVFFESSSIAPEWVENLPPFVTPINLRVLFPKQSSEDLELMCLKIIQSCAPSARLHVSSMGFAGNFVTRFSALLNEFKIIYYQLIQELKSDSMLPFVEPTEFTFVAENLEIFDSIVGPNGNLQALDRRLMLGYGQ